EGRRKPGSAATISPVEGSQEQVRLADRPTGARVPPTLPEQGGPLLAGASERLGGPRRGRLGPEPAVNDRHAAPGCLAAHETARLGEVDEAASGPRRAGAQLPRLLKLRPVDSTRPVGQRGNLHGLPDRPPDGQSEPIRGDRPRRKDGGFFGGFFWNVFVVVDPKVGAAAAAVCPPS